MVAIIYKPSKTATQSGKSNTKLWLLEYDVLDTRFINPLMNWDGNTDTQQQVKLKFEKKEEAIEYAKRENIEYYVIDPKVKKISIQSYSDNFK